ncbi:MAG: 6-carboxytetrahydropterin synthase [Methanoregula sp.]
MTITIYKEVQIDASHRLLYYKGKCANLHGHRWKIEVWMEGEPDTKTGILIDYNTIKKVIGKYDHQVILNRDDPMVPCLEKFQHVLTTPGDPTSERLARIFTDEINAAGREENPAARVRMLRVWESPNCYAEIAE